MSSKIDQFSSEAGQRKRETRVILPEKGASRSQYVERDKARKEKEEKEKLKEKQKKKFINMNHNTKKFNGVILGPEGELENSSSGVSNKNRRSTTKKAFDSEQFAKSANMRFMNDKRNTAEHMNRTAASGND